MNRTIELMENHNSIRKYTDKKIDAESVSHIIKCAQMASTSSHFQAYSIIEVQDMSKREQLKFASGGQDWLIQAPLVLLFCADLHRGSKYFEQVDQAVLGNTECYTVAVIDAALAAQNAFVAAESMGLGGVIVGGIRNEVELVAKVFELPDRVAPLFALCLGYPDDQPGIKPRLPMNEIYKIDFYDESNQEQNIADYNATVKEYYEQRTAGKTKDRWTERCGRLLMAKTRDEVGVFFRKIGLLNK